jgi:hypothetical protein
MIASMASRQPIAFVFILIGATLLVGMVFGIDFVVSGALKLLLGALGAMALVFGSYQMMQRKLKLGLLLIAIALAIFAALGSGVIA